MCGPPTIIRCKLNEIFVVVMVAIRFVGLHEKHAAFKIKLFTCFCACVCTFVCLFENRIEWLITLNI